MSNISDMIKILNAQFSIVQFAMSFFVEVFIQKAFAQ